MPIDPKSVKWDATPQLDASKIQWDDAPASSASGFKSGEAFKDTKSLIPSMEDIEKAWEQFKKEFKDSKSLSELQELAKKSPEAKAAIEAKMQGDVSNARGLGNSVFDNALALPAMLAGGVAGTVKGVTSMDASKGLKSGEEAMHALLPSTLMGNEDAQQSDGYKVGMAPVTAVMDTLNAVPQGYGEILNAAGFPNAAGQVTDAGKLAIMVGAGYHGAKGMIEGVRGKSELATDHADKIDPAKVKWDDAPPNQHSASDRGIAPNEANPQGELFSPERPTAPIDEAGQGDLFNGMPPKFGDSTVAHADDYAAVNPYDVGGHVSEAQAGRPATIDNPQGDLLGGPSLQDAQAGPRVGQESIMHNTIPYEKTFPFGLVPKDEVGVRGEMGLNMPEKNSPLGFAQDTPASTPQAPTPNRWEQGPVGSRDAARAKREQKAREEEFRAKQEAEHKAMKEAAFQSMADLANQSKERDLNHMEAQKELDFADTASSVEQTPGRNFFTEPTNREKVVRPEDSHARGFFLDPANRDKMDFHSDHDFAGEHVGDKSLMHPEATHAMTDALSRGDINGAMDAIIQNHTSVAYRNLAAYLKGKLEGIKMVLHNEGILAIGDKHATGYFDPESRTVGLSRVGAVSPHTVLHELVHALTSDFVNNRPGDMRVLGIKDLFNKLNDLGMQKEFPGIVNVKEFLAEAFSNPEFQDFLKDHKVAERSVWKRFVENVKSILGISSTTRNAITNALEHTMDLGKQIIDADKMGSDKQVLKDSGVPGKLSDLMVSRKKRPEPVNTRKSEDVQRLKVPALKDAISDFKFEDRPMEEIIKEARTQDDIPNTLMEKLSHQLQAGGLFESLKTRNLVVKKTYERITRAMQEATHDIKTYLTDPETGLKAYMRDLTPDEKGEIHSAMIMEEGQRVMSSQELRQRGFNEKQIAYYQKSRELSDQFFNKINERRKELGMAPMDQRVAHMAGRFMGDFSRFVFAADGKKIVGRIAGNTKWELDRASKFIAEQHPEWQMGKQEYNTLGKGKHHADRFGGLMEALNFITKTDSDAAKLMDSYKAYMQKDAINYLNATRHAKAKVKEAGGIKGSEGNKPWLDAKKNAEQGMKAQLAYFEQGYQWMAMEKAVHDLKPLLGDEELVKQTPNALQWAEQYKQHALGVNQGPLSDAANWTASKLGEYSTLGHTNLFKATNLVKHLTMQKFMGLMNIPFSITQMMQPFQVHPPMMALLKTRGLEFSAADAQVKAIHTYLKALTREGTGKLDDFEKQAMEFADKMGIVDVKMADHTKDINSSPLMESYNKIADMNIVIPERLTRGTSFLFYSHILKDAGVPVKDIFGAAENLTNMTMVNYHPIERPMGYAKLGWLGDVASTLTRYKHNQASQMAFYTREGIHSGTAKGYAPMATFLATSIAFGGALGFFGFQEADSLYQLATEYLGKPDTLTNVVLSSGMPEVLSHGVFSTLGLDMTTRFSNANFIPNSIPEALMPFGSAVLDVAQNTARVVNDPTSVTKQKQFAKSIAPQSIQGVLENKLFTEKQADGRNLYQNGTAGPNMGKGRVYRSDSDMALRAFGFRNITESKELAKNYSDTQIEKANKNVVDGLLTKVKYDAMDGKITPQKLQEYASRAAKYGESPESFASKVVAWEGARHLSQQQQIQLRNALSGFRGAVNVSQGR